MLINSFLRHIEVALEDDDLPLQPRFCDAADIYLASRTGDLERVKTLVETHGVNVNKRDFWDSVPLYYACLCGHFGVVEYLLQQGAICSENTFDGDRCLYGALTIRIRNLLLTADVTKVPPLKPLAASVRRLCSLCDDPDQPVSSRFQLCSDLELSSGDEIYRVNRVILASRLKRFDEMLSKQTATDTVRQIRLIDDNSCHQAIEALLVYVYCEKVDMDLADVEELRRLAEHYGSPALLKMTDKELHCIKYFSKSLRKNRAPKRFILYPFSFPDEASLEHDLRSIYHRSRSLDAHMTSSTCASPNDSVRNDYADAVLAVGSTFFRVHLCILCSRSEFFEHLAFSSEDGFEALSRMKCPIFGADLAVLQLADVDIETLGHVLEYFYTESFNSLPDSSLSDGDLLSRIFELCNRFLVLGAKRLIAERIRRISLSMVQTCQLLITADFFEVAQLRDECLQRLAERLDTILKHTETSRQRLYFEIFVAEVAPEKFTDAETLFDSSSTKGDFHGVIDGNTVSGIGSNTILEDLRERYLELYGWKGEERDLHAQHFDNMFLEFAAHAVQKHRN